jgi:hypothetical protein
MYVCDFLKPYLLLGAATVIACPGLQEAQLRHCGSTLKEKFPMKFVRDETVRHRTHILQLLVDYQLRS